MSGGYKHRIARALQLVITMPESARILGFYAELARFQQSVFDQVRTEGTTDVAALQQFTAPLRKLLERVGPDRLQTVKTPDTLVAAYWAGDRSASLPQQCFARVLLQPFAEYLATRGTPDTRTTASRCPFCGSNPVAGVLRGEGDGAKRSLICGLCSTEWQFRRIACPNCGETDKEKLPFFVADQINYVRVEACDTCHTYVKSIDLTRNGHAVPIVDELATMALNIWADDHGFTKVELNLLGM
jgi:FdhE protein